MHVERIADGLWRWTTEHPAWVDADAGPDGWDAAVGCTYLEAQDALVLIDPLAPLEADAANEFWQSLDDDVAREQVPVHIVITCRWHGRSAADVHERYAGSRVWAPACDDPRLADVVTDLYADGDLLPGGIEALLTGRPFSEDPVLWLPQHATVVPGDTIVGGPDGTLRLVPASWCDHSDAERAWYRDELRPSLARLLDRPVERVLVSHGEPVLANGAEALEAALA